MLQFSRACLVLVLHSHGCWVDPLLMVGWLIFAWLIIQKFVFFSFWFGSRQAHHKQLRSMSFLWLPKRNRVIGCRQCLFRCWLPGLYTQTLSKAENVRDELLGTRECHSWVASLGGQLSWASSGWRNGQSRARVGQLSSEGSPIDISQR